MKYKEWLTMWFEHYLEPSAKKHTQECYKSLLNNHILPKLGEYDLDEITPMVIQQFITEQLSAGNGRTGAGLSPNTVNLTITIIQESLEVAHMLGYVSEYSANKVKRPKVKEKKVECFSKEEQKRIEQAVLTHKKPKMFGVLLCLYTGLRVGEVLALEWNDIDFSKKELYVTKSCMDGKSASGGYQRLVDTPKTDTSVRTIPLPKQLIAPLKEIRAKNHSRYVVGDYNKIISVRSYQRSFELLLKKLKIRHRGFHSLRHTFATRALECGMDVKTLSEILGHKSPTVTLKRYAHSMMDHKKEMMDRVGKLL